MQRNFNSYLIIDIYNININRKYWTNNMARTSICLWNPWSFKLFLARLSLLHGRYYGGHVISTCHATLLFFCRRRCVTIQTRAAHETNLVTFLSLTQQVSWSQLASGGLLVFSYYSTVQAFQKTSSSSALVNGFTIVSWQLSRLLSLIHSLQLF